MAKSGKVCAYCGEEIENGDYYLSGTDLHEYPPASIYTHNNGCHHEWRKLHPDGTLRPAEPRPEYARSTILQGVRRENEAKAYS